VFRAFPLLTNLPIPAFRAQSAIKQSAQKIGERIIEDRRKIGDDSLLGRNDLLSVLMRMNRDVDEQALLDHVSLKFSAIHSSKSIFILSDSNIYGSRDRDGGTYD